MKETFPPRLLQGSSPSQPLVLATGMASLECGCHVYVGKRLDTHENATAAAACGAHHHRILEAFMRLQNEHPYRDDGPLVGHVERLLLAAAGR